MARPTDDKNANNRAAEDNFQQQAQAADEEITEEDNTGRGSDNPTLVAIQSQPTFQFGAPQFPGIDTFGGRNDVVSSPATGHRYQGVASGHETPVRPWTGASVGALSPDMHERYLQLVRAAKAVHPDNPMMQRLVVAQALLESGAKLNSGLAQHNNFFGIKGAGTAGTGNYQTRENYGGNWTTINAGFAQNATPEDSFLQHAALLERPRYHGVQEAAVTGDFAAVARAVKDAGYATDPDYAGKLIAIDRRMASIWAEASQDRKVAAADPPTPTTPTVPKKPDVASLRTVPSTIAPKVDVNNGTKPTPAKPVSPPVMAS